MFPLFVFCRVVCASVFVFAFAVCFGRFLVAALFDVFVLVSLSLSHFRFVCFVANVYLFVCVRVLISLFALLFFTFISLKNCDIDNRMRY